jgi:hypothetical protein
MMLQLLGPLRLVLPLEGRPPDVLDQRSDNQRDT